MSDSTRPPADPPPARPAEPREPVEPTGPPPAPLPAQPPRRGSYAWPVAFVLVIAILTFAGLYVFQSLRDLPGDAVRGGKELIQELATVAAAFKTNTVETSFASYATEVAGQSRLQFATVKQVEVFRQVDRSSTFWGAVPLPDVVVEATAPVEYTYYLDLEEDWEFVRQDGIVHVLAPRPRPNTPAVDASQIRYEVREGSLFRDTEGALENLKSGLTTLAARRSRENLALVREIGRDQVEAFVETWMLNAFSDGGDYRVEVIFEDEIPGRVWSPEDEGADGRGGRGRLGSDPVRPGTPEIGAPGAGGPKMRSAPPPSSPRRGRQDQGDGRR